MSDHGKRPEGLEDGFLDTVISNLDATGQDDGTSGDIDGGVADFDLDALLTPVLMPNSTPALESHEGTEWANGDTSIDSEGNDIHEVSDFPLSAINPSSLGSSFTHEELLSLSVDGLVADGDPVNVLTDFAEPPTYPLTDSASGSFFAGIELSDGQALNSPQHTPQKEIHEVSTNVKDSDKTDGHQHGMEVFDYVERGQSVSADLSVPELPDEAYIDISGPEQLKDGVIQDLNEPDLLDALPADISDLSGELAEESMVDSNPADLLDALPADISDLSGELAEESMVGSNPADLLDALPADISEADSLNTPDADSSSAMAATDSGGIGKDTITEHLSDLTVDEDLFSAVMGSPYNEPAKSSSATVSSRQEAAVNAAVDSDSVSSVDHALQNTPDLSDFLGSSSLSEEVVVDGSTFNLSDSLGPIASAPKRTAETNLPLMPNADADSYLQRLSQVDKDDSVVDSSQFLHNPSTPNRVEPELGQSSMTESTQQPARHLEENVMPTRSRWSLAAAVLISVMLSSAATYWWSEHSPHQLQKNAELTALKDEFNTLKGNIDILKSATESGDGVTLLSAYEELSKKQAQLTTAQSDLLEMLKSQNANAAQFEKDMIDRLELVVSFAKQVADQQSVSENRIRGELAQTVVMEVGAKTAGLDKNKIAALEAGLAASKNQMAQLEKDIKAQGQLVSLLEGETEYVRNQVQSQSQTKRTASSTAPNVSVKTASAAASEKSPTFSSGISDYVVIGVYNSGDNGFEIFLQQSSAVNSSSFETYYFKPGELTQIPGYGNILNVQDTGGDDYAVPYQVVTEKGVIRGRKR